MGRVKSQEGKKSDNLQAEVKVKLEEENDREFRLRNLILLGVPEHDTDDMAVGKAGVCLQRFLQAYEVDMSHYEITDTTRLLGGKANCDYITEPRPLRVRFEAADMVGKVARESRHLEDCNDQVVKKIKVFRDRTEREERKKLIKEVQDKSGEEEDYADKWIVDYEKNWWYVWEGYEKPT